MIDYRKEWNTRQTAFRELLLSFKNHDEAMQGFFTQHARLHTRQMAESEPWSFEDEVLDDMPDALVRRIPRNGEHSVAWIIWHIARIEDVTMNMLVAGELPLAEQEGWFERLQTPVRHTGNAMDVPAVAELSAAIDIPTLRAYRKAVGQRTRQIVQQLDAEDLKKPAEPARLQRILDEGIVLEEARSITEYWGRRSIAELLLMPPTRHCYLHLNEAVRLKQKKE